jgi:hypothetical protein
MQFHWELISNSMFSASDNLSVMATGRRSMNFKANIKYQNTRPLQLVSKPKYIIVYLMGKRNSFHFMCCSLSVFSIPICAFGYIRLFAGCWMLDVHQAELMGKTKVKTQDEIKPIHNWIYIDCSNTYRICVCMYGCWILCSTFSQFCGIECANSYASS